MRIVSPPKTAIVLLTVVAVMAVCIGAVFVILSERSRDLEHCRLETMSLAQMLSDETEQTFEATDLLLLSVQERLENEYGRQFTLESLPVHLMLSARAAGAKQVRALFLVAPDGTVVGSSRQHPVEVPSAADREYFKVLHDDPRIDRFLGTPVRSLMTKEWTLHMSRRISDGMGGLRGVLVAAVNLAYLEHLYSFMKLDFVRPIALYSDQGTLIASLPHRTNEIGDRPPGMEAWLKTLAEGEIRMVTHTSGDRTQEQHALGRVRRFPLVVGVTNVEEEALAAWRETAVPIAIGALLVSLLIMTAAWLLVMELRRRGQLSQALTDAEDRHRKTVDSMMDAVVAVDERQDIVMFNPAAERMFRLAASVAIGTPLDRLIPSKSRPAHRTQVTDFMNDREASRSMAPNRELTGVRADGTEFPAEAAISRTMIGGKVQLTAVLRDITERKRAAEKLLEMNRQLHELSTSLQNVREQERSRLSRELHDEVGQQLTGLKLELSWLTGRLRNGQSIAVADVDPVRHQIEGAIATVRRIASELRPLILDELGFGEAVSWHADEFSKRSGIEVSVSLPAADLVSGEDTATALYRIVQESLTNVARHASASRADIGLVSTPDGLVLTIHDNGKGFVVGGEAGRGIGLLSMRERATALGGDFRISSGHEGTTVTVSVPMRHPAASGAQS